MTDHDVTRVLNIYEQRLENIRPPYMTAELVHCKAMISKIRGFQAEGKIQPTHRFLGFIQGVFYCCHLYSIEEMRKQNRGEIFRPPSPIEPEGAAQ